MTCSGWPVKRLRRMGSWVATPTGQVLRWHLRIMMQPEAISGAVAKPYSSAPRSAATATSRPVRNPPSACTAMRPRSPFRTKVCWVVARQLTALAGLGALRHLDLDVVGIDQIFGGDAEAARRHLLDLGAHRIAIGKRHKAVRLLAAFAGVGTSADAVHGDGEIGMRLA